MKVLVADDIGAGLNMLKADSGFQVELRPTSPQVFTSELETCEALLVRSDTKVTAEMIQSAKTLKLIGRAGVGVDNIDVPAASKRGIVVVNVPGGNTISAAEHAMALLFALARNIPQADSHLKASRWERTKFIGTELAGKTLGLIGIGRVGREVARHAVAFGMKVLAADPYISEEYAKSLEVSLTNLETVLSQADFLSLHVPLNETTHYLLNRETLAKTKPGVRIINCARGGLIDEAALAEGLRSGHIKGAALDVFEQEPPLNSPLLKLENVIVTPHLGASTEEAQLKVAEELASVVRDYFLHHVVRNAVNFPALDQETYRELEPYLALADKLGRFQAQSIEGGIVEVRLDYAGDLTRYRPDPLTRTVLQGLLTPILGDEVNSVNAPLLTQERGIKVLETKTSYSEDYTSLLTVTVRTNRETSVVAGTLFSRQHPRIVRIGELSVDVVPEGHLLIYSNRDRPGVIGFVGTVLGNNGVNIAGMQVGRKTIGGEAVTVVTVDSAVPAPVLEEIRRFPGITRIRRIEL
ncbi:MAG: phosphoglycerate dehydrogenase [Elusimicrobia bacterium]|nr:phosphoglycerate dehydrogenase [Elusimicrobiota bacterium]